MPLRLGESRSADFANGRENAPAGGTIAACSFRGKLGYSAASANGTWANAITLDICAPGSFGNHRAVGNAARTLRAHRFADPSALHDPARPPARFRRFGRLQSH